MATETTELTAGALELWLDEMTRTLPGEDIFWAPHRRATASDWIRVRSVEHLAVLISTANRNDNNVCFVGEAPSFEGRTANVIGLVTRPRLGWAVVANESGPGRAGFDVQTIGYRYTNYESFGALAAAEIGWAWVSTGGLPSHLTGRRRTR